MESESLAVIEVPPGGALVVNRQPEIVLAEAQRAARALKEVIDSKAKPVVFNGETYLEFEDWQTVGRFYGIAPRIASTRYVEYGAGITGFEAHAEAVHVESGKIVASAEGMCLTDEEKWRSRPKYAWVYVKRSGGVSVEDPGSDEIVWEDNPSKPGKKRPRKAREVVGEETVPLFQLRSMAQTRAGAKALRNALAWVVVLAGYRPTPAEEMDGVLVPDGHEKPLPPFPVPPEKPRTVARPQEEMDGPAVRRSAPRPPVQATPTPEDPFGTPEQAAGRPPAAPAGNGKDPRPGLARTILSLRTGFKTQPSPASWRAIVSFFAGGGYLDAARHTKAALETAPGDEALATLASEALEALAAFMKSLSAGKAETVQLLKGTILAPK